MKAYAPNTSKGRTVGGHDIHHKTADQSKPAAKAAAKSMRHAARQQGKKQSTQRAAMDPGHTTAATDKAWQ